MNSDTKYFVIENLIQPQECDILIQYYDEIMKTRKVSDKEQVFHKFDGRTINIGQVYTPNVHFIMNKVRMDLVNIIKINFNIDDKQYIYPANTEIVKWAPDELSELGVHRDTSYQKHGRKHKTFYNQWTTVTYLNGNKNRVLSELQGGETIVDGDVIIPEQCKTIVFRSDILHSVNEVTRGRRYTMPIWYTNIENYYEDIAQLNRNNSALSWNSR